MGSQGSKDQEQSGNWREINESSIEYLLGHDGKRKLLGAGGAGSVYLAVLKNELVAVKKLHNPDLENERNEFIQEMRLLAELDSPYVVRYLGGSVTENILITEFMQNGDLRNAIMTQNPMVRWENRGAAIMLDIAKGLAFLHSQRLIHRDLKSPNILLSSDFRAKLADVGIARGLAPGQNKIDTLSVKFSLRWASPENFTREDYTTLTDKSDIYSLGVILWEIMAQSMPWDHVRWEYEICRKVSAGEYNPIPENCPENVSSLMKRCLALKPEDRPSALEVVSELESLMSNFPAVEPVENLVLRFSGERRDGDPKLGPDGNLILKEGILSLKSVWLQVWHLRYFTLTSRNIIYWTYNNNLKAREIRISLFKIRKTRFYRNTANSAGCMFEFTTFSRTYAMLAPNATAAADWVAAIELAKGNTMSTRDTVMEQGEMHPNPIPVIESYKAASPPASAPHSTIKEKMKRFKPSSVSKFLRRIGNSSQSSNASTDSVHSDTTLPTASSSSGGADRSASVEVALSKSAPAGPSPVVLHYESPSPEPEEVEEEEQITELDIPAEAIGSLQGSTGVERTRTGTMVSADGATVLTPCYYEADQNSNQAPPTVLALMNVNSYTELLNTVVKSFPQLENSQGFSLWSKLEGSQEIFEILESEYEDWKSCVSQVDKILVRGMCTPQLVTGDDDLNQVKFRLSRTFSNPIPVQTTE